MFFVLTNLENNEVSILRFLKLIFTVEKKV